MKFLGRILFSFYFFVFIGSNVSQAQECTPVGCINLTDDVQYASKQSSAFSSKSSVFKLSETKSQCDLYKSVLFSSKNNVSCSSSELVSDVATLNGKPSVLSRYKICVSQLTESQKKEFYCSNTDFFNPYAIQRKISGVDDSCHLLFKMFNHQMIEDQIKKIRAALQTQSNETLSKRLKTFEEAEMFLNSMMPCEINQMSEITITLLNEKTDISAADGGTVDNPSDLFCSEVQKIYENK
jgi:hypothetical protein